MSSSQSFFSDFNQNTKRNYDCDNNNNKIEIYVADSNIYIDNLDLVKTMVERGILGVPWTVHDELDNLKSKFGSKGFHARSANRWLEEKTKDMPDNILFQKWSDVAPCEKPDDRIIKYCLDLKISEERNLMFVTNDINPSNRARIMGITVSSESDLLVQFNKVVSAKLPCKAQAIFIMISEAIQVLNDRSGSSRQDIAKYLHDSDATITIVQVGTALKKGLAAGLFKKGSAPGCFIVGDKATNRETKNRASKSRAAKSRATKN